MSKRLLAVLISVTVVVIGSAGTALAVPVDLEHTGQGTNEDGTCETVEHDNEVAAGQQVWHFLLTGQTSPGDATMDATFDDGTSVSDLAPESTPGQTAHFFVTTAQGAALTSATAHFDSEQAGANPQFTVSNCFTGGVGGENGGNGENGNGDENGNGKENGNGDEGNGEEPADEESPAPMPTDVPAGVTSAGDGGISGTASLVMGALALAAAAAAGLLLRRRLVDGA